MEVSPVQHSKIRSRLKAQLARFTGQLTAGRSKPLRNFVGEMLFGIQASQGVKLSNLARSLQEEIPLLKTEDRLSRNLQAQELETHLRQGLLRLGRHRVESNTVLCLDLRDVRKEYARKMEFLDQVWDGSAGEVHPGYWLCSVTGAEVHGNELTPLYQQLFSVRAQDFVSENDELLSAIDQLRAQTAGRGIWAMDRGRRPAQALGAAAGAARTLCYPLHRTARGTGPAAPSRDATPSGGLLPAPLSGQNHQDRQRPGESVPTALRRRTVPPAGPRGTTAVGGGGRLGTRTALAADQPVRSAGLAIAMVDRTNLPDAVEN